jgi:hypothetical protein
VNVNTEVKDDDKYTYITKTYTDILNRVYLVNFEITIYVIEINVLTVLNGGAGLKFS